MTEERAPHGSEKEADTSFDKLTYEQKTEKLEDILKRLDNSETPIDKLAEDVKLGAKLIKDLGKKLNQVESEVKDAFKELEGGDEEG